MSNLPIPVEALMVPKRNTPKHKKPNQLANGKAQERMAKVGVDAICDRIAGAETITSIAQDIGVSLASLSRYLTRDESLQSYMRARTTSAEAWIDKGMAYLLEAPANAAEVQRARCLADLCSKRAAIVNPRYSERAAIELTGADGGPIQSQVQVVVHLPDNGRRLGQTAERLDNITS